MSGLDLTPHTIYEFDHLPSQRFTVRLLFLVSYTCPTAIRRNLHIWWDQKDQEANDRRTKIFYKS